MFNQNRILIDVTKALANPDIGGAALAHERHKAVLEALISKDGERAGTIMKMHIQESEKPIIEAIESLGK